MSGLVWEIADLGSKFYPVFELYSVAIHLLQIVSKYGDWVVLAQNNCHISTLLNQMFLAW